MIELVILWLFGSLHAGFAGIRESMGRNLLIRKRRYYFRAAVRGALVGQGASLLVVLTLAGMLSTAPDPGELLATLGAAGQSALAVYAPYTAVVLVTFIPYFVPSVEVRSLVICAVFGTLTLLLPVVILAGAVAAVVAVPRAEVAVLFLVSVASIALVEPVLAATGWSTREAARALDGGRV
jgi:hypothetical protein